MKLKISLTFEKHQEYQQISVVKDDAAQELLRVYTSVLSTPVLERYEEKLRSRQYLEDASPSFKMYRKLKEKAGLNLDDTRDACVLDKKKENLHSQCKEEFEKR